jgi:hypothetical protein
MTPSQPRPFQIAIFADLAGGGTMRRFSFRSMRSHHARMSVAWFVIVALAGSVLFGSIWLAERAQEAAIDSLSTSSLPPVPKP